VKLQHQTEVGASPENVWKFLQNTRVVVACLAGAELVDELGDDRYEGVLKVAVGPLKMSYAGDVTVVERDATARRIVLVGSGRDKRGAGAVQAHVRLQVEPAEGGCRLDVVSDVDLSGRIASLGRGVRDVANRMFVEFAGQLATRVENPAGASNATSRGPAITPAANESAGARASTSAQEPTDSRAGRPSAIRAVDPPGDAGEIKVLPLLWSVTRERLADLLERMSVRVRPH